MVLIGSAVASCARQSGERPRPEYDPSTGRLRALAFDATKSGKHNAVARMDGARFRVIEIDLDGNGQVDRWDFYDKDQRLAKVGLSSRNDGVMDAEAYYSETGQLTQIRISTRRDGRYDRTEFYERDVLIRSEEDTNGDGKVEKWDTYRSTRDQNADALSHAITSTAIDETGTGRPTRRLVFGENGTVVRVEVDPDGDGVFTPLAPSMPGR